MKLALVPVIFDPSSDVPFVVPKVLISHGLSYVLATVLLSIVIQNGRSSRVWSRVHIPVLGFLVMSILATAFAVNPTVALFGTHVRMLGLTTIADGVVTYFAVVELVRNRRDVIAILSSIFVGSTVVVAYALVQWVGKDPLSWSFDGSQRPFSTLGQPTSLGEYLSVLSVVAFGLASFAGRVPRPVRGLLIVYAALLLLVAGLTETRSAAIGVAAAAVVFVVILWAKHPGRKARVLGLLSATGAGTALVVVLLLTPIGARLVSTIETTSDSGAIGLEESASVRLVLYEIAFQIVRERPLLGYGPDNFAAAVPQYRPDPAPFQVRQNIATSAHSWLAYVATSTGVLGLAAYLAVLVVATLALFRSPFHPVAAIAALGAVAYLGSGLTTINSIENDTLFWVAIAAITSSTGSSDRPTVAVARRATRSRSSAGLWVPWVLVGAASLAVATTIPALAASRLAQQSVSARAQGTFVRAVDLSTRATQLDPNRAEYWQQLALAFVTAGRLSDASNAFKSAAKLAPYDIRFLDDDIQVQLLRANAGDASALNEAMRLADRAAHVDPNNPLAHLNRAVVALGRSDLATAVASIDRAIALESIPSDSMLAVASHIYVSAAQTYLAAGRVDEAMRVSRDGVANLGVRPISVAIRVEYARALAASGRKTDALMEIDAALRISPSDPAVLLLRDQLQGK